MCWHFHPDGKSFAGKSYVVFGKVNNSAINLSAIADDINQLQNEEPRLELLQYLSDHASDIPGMSFDVLKSLKL
jgi:hypothetical protein